MKSRIGFLLSRVLLILAVACVARFAHAANITDTTGTSTLSWPSGYALYSADTNWLYAYAPATSYSYASLPSGTYKFQLWACINIPYVGTMCSYDAGSPPYTLSITRDAETAINTTTTQAGTSAYTANVSSRGSASIRVPLRLPGHGGGSGASFALDYDSARASDVSDLRLLEDSLGYGWSLSGVSAIARCRVGLSGSATPLLDSTDRLCLDGDPLIAVSGSYWANGTEYRTETQSLIKVVAADGGGWLGVDEYFVAYYPDGHTATFGYSSDSRVRAVRYPWLPA